MASYIERRKREKGSDWILSQTLLLKTVLRRPHRTEVCISDLAPENRNSNSEHYITYVVAKGQAVTQRKTIFYSLQPQGGGKEGKECCKEGELENTNKFWKKRPWGTRNLCLCHLLSPTRIHFTEGQFQSVHKQN